MNLEHLMASGVHYYYIHVLELYFALYMKLRSCVSTLSHQTQCPNIDLPPYLDYTTSGEPPPTPPTTIYQCG